jgi:hypothetical protein
MTALSAVAIGAGITVASAVVAKPKINATLAQIAFGFMLDSPDSRLNLDQFSLQACSIRQLSLKCADWGEVFNKSSHAESVATLIYRSRNIATLR